MADDNLWDSIKDLDATDIPSPKKAGWGLGAALSTFRARGSDNLGSHHGPTQTGLPTPPTSKSSHGAELYNKPSLSNHNGHGGEGLWNRFGGQQQQEEDEKNLDVGHESSSESSFWNNLRKDHESDNEDASYMKNKNGGNSGIWNRVLGQPGDVADESDYDTDAGDDDWEQQKLESMQNVPGSMLDDMPPSPAPTPQRLTLKTPVPTALAPQPAPTPPPLSLVQSQEETDDEDDVEMIDESADDADSVAPAGGGNADPLDDLGGLGAFLDKGNEKAMEAEMVHMMCPNQDDKSTADMSAIEGSVAPGEAKRLIQQRMQQRMDMSFGKSVCNMSLNPQEVETKERRPWRQQKHLRRGSALGAMPAAQLDMLGVLVAEDDDSEEEDLYQMPTEINNERPVEVAQGGFDDAWKDGNAAVTTEMPDVTPAAIEGAGFLFKGAGAGEGFLPSGSASQQANTTGGLTSLFPQTAEDTFPEELGDSVVEDLFAPQSMKSALPQANSLVGDSEQLSEKRKKKSSSRVSRSVEAKSKIPSSRSNDSKPRRTKSNEEAKLEGDKEDNLGIARKSSRRRDGSRAEDKMRSPRRDQSNKGETEEEHKSSRRKSSRRHKSDGDDDDTRRKLPPRRHQSRPEEEGEIDAPARTKSSRRRESKHGEHRSPRGRSGDDIDSELDGGRRRSKKASSRSKLQSDSEGIDGSKHSNNSSARRKLKEDNAVEVTTDALRSELLSNRVRKKELKGSEDHLEGSARRKERKARPKRKEEDEEDDDSDGGGLKLETKPWHQPKDTKAGNGVDDIEGTEKHENTALARLEARSRAASTVKKPEPKESASLVRDNSRQRTSSTGTRMTAETAGSLECDDTDHKRKESKRTGSIVAKHAAEAAKQPKKRGPRLLAALGLKTNNHAKLEEDEDVNAGLLKPKFETKARLPRSGGGDAKLSRGSQRDEQKHPRSSKGEKAGLLSIGSRTSNSRGTLAPDEEEKAAEKKARTRRSTSVSKETHGREKRREGRRSTSVPRPKRGDVADQLSESSRSHNKKKGSRDSTLRRTKNHMEGDSKEKRELRKKPAQSYSSVEFTNNSDLIAKKDTSNAKRKKRRSRPS